MKRENSVENIALIGLFDAELPQDFKMWKMQ